MINERYVGQIETVVKTVNTEIRRLYTKDARAGIKPTEPLPEAYKGQLDEVMKTVRMG